MEPLESIWKTDYANETNLYCLISCITWFQLKFEQVYEISYFQNIKLITSKNKHRFVAPAGVKQLTKEQWEAFSNEAKWRASIGW